MKNKETLRTAMDRRLSFLDELPSCRASLQQRIAQEEAPVMKKKISFGLVFALALVSLSVIALAAGLLFSPKADAAALADRALAEKYGVTLEMNTFFYRSEEELPDGSIRVTYIGKDLLEYVLGTYTAHVKDGKAEVTWSHDGKNTSGGYQAEAWGAEQLKQMIADSKTTGDQSLFEGYAVAIAEKHDAAWIQPDHTEDEIKAYFEMLEAEKTQALNAAKLPEEEMQALAKEAVIRRYELTDEQAAMLELYVQPLADGANDWYWMEDGKPCFEVQFFLNQDPKVQDRHVDKDGSYAVLVNVETGVIERMVYESGLGGNG